MRVPDKLPIDLNVSGARLKRTINQLIDAVKSNSVVSSPSISVTKAPGGTTLKYRKKDINKGGGGGGAGARYWARVVNSTDEKNYVVNVWQSRDSYENGDSIWQASKQCRVPDLEDALEGGDTFEVTTTTLSGEDFIATQQMGAMG